VKKNIKKLKKEILRNKLKSVIFLLLFISFIFFRFYDIENRSTFSWDQVDNAWAAKNIIDDGKFPLLGMQVRGTTGFYIGPLYYYFITPFYYFANLDPLASGIIAGATAVFAFIVFTIIVKKLFSFNVTLMGLFFLTFSWHLISIDRIQWPVNFIPPISLIIFFSLYKIIDGNTKYAFLLALTTGLMFHLHFTAVLFLPIILISPLLFARTKETVKHLLISVLIFLLLLSPLVINSIQSSGANERNMFAFLNTFYHGFHLTRFIQITEDALIEFSTISFFPYLKYVSYLAYPLFAVALLRTKIKGKKIIIYLGVLWIFVPWIIFSTYSGELTNYYFKMTMPVALISISYLMVKFFELRKILITFPIIAFLVYYAFVGTSKFLEANHNGLEFYRERTMDRINAGEKIKFHMGVPDSYIYYVEVERNEKVK